MSLLILFPPPQKSFSVLIGIILNLQINRENMNLRDLCMILFKTMYFTFHLFKLTLCFQEHLKFSYKLFPCPFIVLIALLSGASSLVFLLIRVSMFCFQATAKWCSWWIVIPDLFKIMIIMLSFIFLHFLNLHGLRDIPQCLKQNPSLCGCRFLQPCLKCFNLCHSYNQKLWLL